MKHTISRVYCYECRKHKFQFVDEESALMAAERHKEKLDLYPYYCKSCCGWHLTHNEPNNGYRSLSMRNIFKRVHAIGQLEVIPGASDKKRKSEHTPVYNNFNSRVRVFNNRLDKHGKHVKVSSMTKLVNQFYENQSNMRDDEKAELQSSIIDLLRRVEEDCKARAASVIVARSA